MDATDPNELSRSKRLWAAWKRLEALAREFPLLRGAILAVAALAMTAALVLIPGLELVNAIVLSAGFVMMLFAAWDALFRTGKWLPTIFVGVTLVVIFGFSLPSDWRTSLMAWFSEDEPLVPQADADTVVSQPPGVDTPDQFASRRAIGAFYNSRMKPTMDALAMFSTRVREAGFNVPMPSPREVDQSGMDRPSLEHAFVGELLIALEQELVSLDRDLRDVLFSDPPKSLDQITAKMNETLCGYERLAHWSQYASLLLPQPSGLSPSAVRPDDVFYFPWRSGEEYTKLEFENMRARHALYALQQMDGYACLGGRTPFRLTEMR